LFLEDGVLERGGKGREGKRSEGGRFGWDYFLFE
jgi:hypothetical protein